MPGEGGGAGRPRRWSSPVEKHRAYRARWKEKAEVVEELLHALRNAALEDPELQRVVHHGSDAEVLRALRDYYRAQNWNLLCWKASKGQPNDQA
jgi:hypothetical protein